MYIYSKAKVVNKNVDKKSQIEYKDVLINKKCLRHSVNRVLSESHRMRASEVNKISFVLWQSLYF